ncbi:hypothetical protein M5K25_000670 [Dendrobium thyrsiflorum]|uniref:Uncharacterized protein n=1 Tax=Dendrobium thyrsiflorum TaxID=117978 RepID=A0ABD0VU55_DENTH
MTSQRWKEKPIPSGVARNLWAPKIHAPASARIPDRMVGGVMMNPIKIPWFRRPGSSWSLVYLVRGGSRPNLTEGSLSAAMGFDVIREHMGDDHDRNIMVPFGGKPPGLEGPGRNRLPTVPFGGKTIDVFTENFGSLPASPPLGGNFRRLQSHHVTRTCMVGVRGHRSRTILSPTTLLERVWGLHVYLSERGAVVSPQAGTYEYPFLAVGVTPGSLLPCYESAYRWFSGPSQTPKKKLLDHPFCHKHRDALPPTTLTIIDYSLNEIGFELNPADGQKCRTKTQEIGAAGDGKFPLVHDLGIWPKKLANRRKLPSQLAAPVVPPAKNVVTSGPQEGKAVKGVRSNSGKGGKPEERRRTSEKVLKKRSKGRRVPSQQLAHVVASDHSVVTPDPIGRDSRRTNGVARRRGGVDRRSARKGGSSLHSRRAPVVSSDRNVVTSDQTRRKVVVGAESNRDQGVEEVNTYKENGKDIMSSLPKSNPIIL